MTLPPSFLALLVFLIVGSSSVASELRLDSQTPVFQATNNLGPGTHPEPVRLVVACLDSFGESWEIPMPAGGYKGLDLKLRRWIPTPRLPENGRVILIRPPFDPASPRHWPYQQKGKVESLSERSWMVTPGKTYFVGMFGAGRITPFQRIVIPEHEHLMRVELTIPDPAPMGQIRMSLLLNPLYSSAKQWRIKDSKSRAVFMASED